MNFNFPDGGKCGASIVPSEQNSITSKKLFFPVTEYIFEKYIKGNDSLSIFAYDEKTGYYNSNVFIEDNIVGFLDKADFFKLLNHYQVGGICERREISKNIENNITGHFSIMGRFSHFIEINFDKEVTFKRIYQNPNIFIGSVNLKKAGIKKLIVSLVDNFISEIPEYKIKELNCLVAPIRSMI